MAPFDENCEILKSDQLGRFLVAKRDLVAGQLVLTEQPLVVGPYWDSDICCLNCFRNSCTICRQCRRAPLCYDCIGHNESECNFYRKSNLDINFLFNHFNVVTAVRCLLLFGTNRAKYDEMLNMEAHLEERKASEIWDILEKYVVRPLLDNEAFEKNADGLEVTGELIQRICGILDVNAFEIRGSEEQQHGVINLARGLYPKTALMTHNCVTNTLISVDGQSCVRLYTTVPVRKGELIYYNYTRCLFGTFERRAHLRKGKYFICSCMRCEDPTELGTHLSSVTCTECKEGLCSYNSKESKWECNKCSNQLNRDYVKMVFTSARNDAMACSFDIDDLERVITKHSTTLNPRNSLVLEVKQTLAGELRSICQSAHSSNVPQKILERKLELCAEMLQILRVLEPGISRLSGIALYEYNTALWDLCRRKFETKEIKAAELLDNLVNAEIGLKESIRMSLFEHPATPEGQLSKRAMFELKELRGEITQVRAMVEGKSKPGTSSEMKSNVAH
ncbi:SET domain-containing protein SmydA-8-like [Topomyia yanbarensis]|uniref:SET domain-containing protein SmydA-8-like n=1 Tax=Topomyia yanbarensis TaxID=2498891 RepID=UPI00273C799E|nr:SET domain-containing protein SmydA-8-like [Topomyia yanbarensis]